MFYSYNTFCDGINRITDNIRADNYKFNYIVGIARGGLIPATVLAYRFKKPVLLIEWSTRDMGKRIS